MKKLLILIFIFSAAVCCLAQPKDAGKKTDAALDIVIKKQIICDQLERQTQEIQFAAVRVYIRYKIAAWLWKDGKDNSGRAEGIAIRAVEDLYENESDVPQYYLNYLSSNLLTLLDLNAKDSAAELRKKYKITSANNPELLFNQKDGDKLIADDAIKSLGRPEANLELPYLLSRLQERQSPEFFTLLNAIIQAEETGRAKFTSTDWLFISGYFVQGNVPAGIQKSFLKLIISKSKNAAQTPGGDVEGFFNVLSRLMPNVSAKFPELLGEAGIAQNMLKTQVSAKSRESQESGERIDNSPDELSAIVTEAEKTDDPADKYDLYVGAARLALKLQKFTYAVDLSEKTAEIRIPASDVSEDFQKRLRDQFYAEVAEKALKANDADSANYAAKKMTSFVKRADSLGKIADYYIDQKDPIFARSTLEDAVKFASKTENGISGLYSLIELIPIAQKIDPNYVFTLNELATKCINAIPALNVEDKPQTENYKNYVDSVMIINGVLLPAITKLLKINKIAATDLTNRINKKEVKIAADFVVSIDSLNQSADRKEIAVQTKNPL